MRAPGAWIHSGFSAPRLDRSELARRLSAGVPAWAFDDLVDDYEVAALDAMAKAKAKAKIDKEATDGD